MTNPMHPEELISASLTGDLSDAERADLDRHLAGCARCRDLLSAMTADRQLLAGLRRESAPRRQGAPVRPRGPARRTRNPQVPQLAGAATEPWVRPCIAASPCTSHLGW